MQSLRGTSPDPRQFHFFTDKVGAAWSLTGTGPLKSYQPFVERFGESALPQSDLAVPVARAYGTGDLPDVQPYLASMLALQALGAHPTAEAATTGGAVSFHRLLNVCAPRPGLAIARVEVTRKGSPSQISSVVCRDPKGQVVLETRFDDYQRLPDGKSVPLRSTTTFPPRTVDLAYPVTIRQGEQTQEKTLTATQAVPERTIERTYRWAQEYQRVLPESTTLKGSDGTLIYVTYSDFRLEDAQGDPVVAAHR